MKLAIQGDPTRGHKVIQILESLGGKNIEKLEGTYETFYYVDYKNEICDDHKKNFPPTYKLYTLEEFEKEFPFKVGDKVIINNDCIGIVEKLIPEHISAYCVNTNNVNCWCTPSTLRLYKEMKEERNITLTLDKAKEWYKKGGELKEIALQAYSEGELNSLPRSWEEFCEKYPIKRGECILEAKDRITVAPCNFAGNRMFKNWIPSQKSAEAHLAMIQLEQLRDCWRQGWEPDWNDDYQPKYCVTYYHGEFEIRALYEARHFLSFPNREMAKEFLKCFRDLIEKAGDLI